MKLEKKFHLRCRCIKSKNFQVLFFNILEIFFINRSTQNEVALFSWAVHFLRFCLFILDRTSDFCGEQGKKQAPIKMYFVFTCDTFVSAVTQFLLMFHFISTFLKYSSAVLCGRMLHNVSSLLINTMKFFYKLNFLRRYLFRYVVCFNVVRLRCIWCRFGKSSRDIDITIASYSLLFFYN